LLNFPAVADRRYKARSENSLRAFLFWLGPLLSIPACEDLTRTEIWFN